MRNTFTYPLLLPQTFNYKYFVVLMVIIRFFHPKLCMTCNVCMYVCMFVYHTRWHSKEYKAVLSGGGHCACMCMSYKVAQHSIAGWWRALCMYVYVIQGGTESSAGWWRALCMYVYVIQGGTAQHCRVVEGIMHVCVCHTRWHSKEYKAVLGGGGHYACMCMSYKVAQQSSAGWWRALYVCM